MAAWDGEVQQRAVLHVTEKEFLEIIRKKGFDDWDVDVALGALRKGVILDLGGKVKYAIKD